MMRNGDNIEICLVTWNKIGLDILGTGPLFE